MPLSDTIITQAVMDAIVAEIVEKPCCIWAALGLAWMYRNVFNARRLSVLAKPVLWYRFSQKCPVLFSIRLKHMAVYQLSQCMILGSSSGLLGF
jgi:hypothetical protein